MRRTLLGLTLAVFALIPAAASAQVFTVINQAHVRPAALAKVERAVVAQSRQLQAAWMTPTASFGPGGWKLYLKTGPQGQATGVHFYNGSPYLLVWTGGAQYGGWSAYFSHEIVETLVDPGITTYNTGDGGHQLEVADPVETHDYRLRGVWVADFVLPAWYAGASATPCAATLDGTVCPGPLLAPVGNAGPWDHMRLLARPWQTLPNAYLP